MLKGYSHAGENVRIAELLMGQVVELVNEMGIASVKHLKVGSKTLTIYKLLTNSLKVYTTPNNDEPGRSIRHSLSSTAADFYQSFGESYGQRLASHHGSQGGDLKRLDGVLV